REVVRFGGARGEDHLARLGADQLGNLAAGALHPFGHAAAEDVILAVWIAELFGEERQHELEDPGVGRRRCLVVEVDRPIRPVVERAHAGTASILAAWTASRAASAARQRSRSARRLDQPKDRRSAQRASLSGTPMAASTWDGATLPDEQAAPEESA